MGLFRDIDANGCVVIRQRVCAPSVYLDHWAFMTLSEDIILQDRFIDALRKRGGTLLVSHQNLAEFSRIERPEHADKAEKFLQKVLPDVYFFVVDIDQAKAQENSAKLGSILAPVPDLGLMNLIGKLATEEIHQFSCKGIFKAIHEARNSLGLDFESCNEKIAETVSRQKLDPDFVKIAKKYVPNNGVPRTKTIMGELLRPVILDPRASFSANDAADFIHAVIPASYCDYIVLDGKWAGAINAMKKRLMSSEVLIQVARAFSGRKQGLESFLVALETDEDP